MSKSKKDFDERLQELRSQKKEKLQYLRRKQMEEEADKAMKDYEKSGEAPSE